MTAPKEFAQFYRNQAGDLYWDVCNIGGWELPLAPSENQWREAVENINYAYAAAMKEAVEAFRERVAKEFEKAMDVVDVSMFQPDIQKQARSLFITIADAIRKLEMEG